MNFSRRPLLKIIEEDSIKTIVNKAYGLLESVGVKINNSEALDILAQNGAKVDFPKKTAWINGSMIDKALKTVPSMIDFYNEKGEKSVTLGGDNISYVPGASALYVLDSKTKKMRTPVTDDLINFIRVTDALDNIAFSHPALVLSDVPKKFSDVWRYFLTILNTSKPLSGGVFTIEATQVIKEMLVVMSGDEKEMRQKPRTSFSCCPSSPLRWDEITCQNLIDCAKYGIPVRVLALPISGGSAPATLSGTVLQHTAENLSGIVIHQLVNPGAPIYYGGSPAILDMKKGTTPMGAIETHMIDIAYCQIGRYLGMPTHTIMALSDSKVVDTQAGLESGVGIILGALAGINMIAGCGMLDFESCQSPEKLVIDNDICGMAYRLVGGINCSESALGADVIQERAGKGDFLDSPHTLQWFKKEFYFPSSVIDRASRREFEDKGSQDTYQKAKEMVRKILDEYELRPFPNDKKKELVKIVKAEVKKYGLDQLPNYEI